MSLMPPPADAYRDLVRRALAADAAAGEVDAAAPAGEGARCTGVFVANAPLVVAGMDVVAEVFRQLDTAAVCEVQWGDGSRVDPGEILARVTATAHAVHTGRRTALTFLRRLCGIATLTAPYVQAAGGDIRVIDAGVRTAAFGALDAYAVRCGGATPREAPEADAFVEVDALNALDAVLASGPTHVRLIGLSTYDIREAMRRIAGRARVEIVGRVTLERIPELATTGADQVQVDALTLAPPVDIRCDIEPA